MYIIVSGIADVNMVTHQTVNSTSENWAGGRKEANTLPLRQGSSLISPWTSTLTVSPSPGWAPQGHNRINEQAPTECAAVHVRCLSKASVLPGVCSGEMAAIWIL
jgi:hypothetical protein